MAGLVNALLMIPMVLVMRYLVNEMTSISPIAQRIANAVSWQTKEWHVPSKRLTDSEMVKLTELTQQDLQHFNQTLDAILVARPPDTDAHRRVRQYIENRMRRLGWTVTNDVFQATTPHGVRQFANIMATFDPAACRRLVLACHYDSKVFPDGFLGATDSAVPCTMLIHLATALDRYLKAHRDKATDTTIQLIFFDGEEAFEEWTETDSLYGSRHLAYKWNRTPFPKTADEKYKCGHLNRMESELDRMEVMVLLDLLGEPSPTFYSYFPGTHALYMRLHKAEAKLNELKKMESHPPQSRTNYFLDRQSFSGIEDDHIPFHRRGVPIVHVIPSPFPRSWHTESDNRGILHHPTINNLIKIFKIFVVQYLHLDTSV